MGLPGRASPRQRKACQGSSNAQNHGPSIHSFIVELEECVSCSSPRRTTCRITLVSDHEQCSAPGSQQRQVTGQAQRPWTFPLSLPLPLPHTPPPPGL